VKAVYKALEMEFKKAVLSVGKSPNEAIEEANRLGINVVLTIYFAETGVHNGQALFKLGLFNRNRHQRPDNIAKITA